MSPEPLTDDSPLPPLPRKLRSRRALPPAPGESGVSPGPTLTAALIGFFLVTLDASVVNVALPAMGRELHGGLAGLQWVVDGYTLAFAALMLSTGALADRVGASRAFAAGTAVFTAASVACGLAPDLVALVAARVVQGTAAAVVLPSSLALVRQAFPDARKRARAISVWAAGGSTAVALGPVLGGALTTAWSWRAIFFVNLPVGVAALLLASRVARSPRRPAPLDLPGQAAAVVALAATTYAVIEGGRVGATAAAVAAVALAVFLAVESRHPHPVVPLGLFRNATVSVSLATGAALSFAFYGVIFVLSLFFQEVRGQSAMTAGLMFLPMTVLISTVNVVSGKATNRYGPRVPMIVGQVVAAAGLLVLLPVGTGTPPPVLALAMAPLGLGAALAVPALTAAAMGAVPAERAGMAAGVLNAGRQVAGGLAVAVFGSLVGDRTRFLSGMREGLVVSAVLLAATAAATAAGLRVRQTAQPGPEGRKLGGGGE
ncbi:MFS transporter, DHA2 family, methylenomycin A resistance protein [Actinacidiphila yanglinensis]|uniref:MFS transporter, DHA2 family, methylenomycin A resistance protein n=1 Tax=Actinacidiphila yanglinensis TaxID=310779 RepID=A0A1H5U116_9ACTN|nr:MFS transporter [Actinacidiphila yanglinensis]SEF68690.1 MFS transporter, DHA2 family, methylenomycin A resistance protein [Actinacidiphila yanglinensis]